MMTELGRVTKPANGARLSFTLPPGRSSLVVENMLGAVLLCAYGRNPTADDCDFAVPGSALWVLPLLGGATRLNVLVVYPGAIPPSDVQAILWVSERCFAPFVGAIA